MGREKAKTSEYFGVYYSEKGNKWIATRYSKKENKRIYKGAHREEETAAHASDNLARELMANGDYNLKLNFPDDHTEVHAIEPQTNKRKWLSEFEDYQTDENHFEKFQEKKSEDSPKYRTFLGSGFKNN